MANPCSYEVVIILINKKQHPLTTIFPRGPVSSNKLGNVVDNWHRFKMTSWWFFATHLKNMLVELDHLPRDREDRYNMFETTT